jgi:shikimate kinase
MSGSKPIFLCGFMGCGKSAVGKALAELCEKTYIDLDRYIEQIENRSIAQIFEVRGEDYFRKVEKNSLDAVSNINNTVIALGGGTLQNEDRIASLKKFGTLIFINTSLDVIKERLKRNNKRPMLQNENGSRMEDSLLDEYVDHLYRKRVSLYKKADITYEPIQGSPKDQALRIKELLSTS